MNLSDWDARLFQWINQDLANDFFDMVMPYLTNIHKTDLFGKGIFPALLLFWIWKQRTYAVKVILVLVLTAALCDTIAYRGFKSYLNRARPHHAENGHTKSIVRVPYKPKSPSMPSNHATTTAGLAAVASFYYPHLAWAFWLWAGVIAFSRVYVGVHFPSDVIFGLFLGGMIGYILRSYILSRFGIFFRK